MCDGNIVSARKSSGSWTLTATSRIMHLEYNMIYHDFSVTKNLEVFGLFELFMEWIVFLQKEKILSMPFARSVMSTCRALFDILSSSLSLWELTIPLYCVYVCVDLIKNLIKVRFRLFLVVSPRIVVQGFQQSFHGNNEQKYLLFHS